MQVTFHTYYSPLLAHNSRGVGFDATSTLLLALKSDRFFF
jgi:hypothetical protein